MITGTALIIRVIIEMGRFARKSWMIGKNQGIQMNMISANTKK